MPRTLEAVLRLLVAVWFGGLAVLSALAGIDGDPVLAVSYALACGFVAWRVVDGVGRPL